MVLDLCERTIIMSQGTILADGKSEDLLRDEALLVRGSLETPLRFQGCARPASKNADVIDRAPERSHHSLHQNERGGHTA
jgi:ABC-type multidrug transport system ATPase subunit